MSESVACALEYLNKDATQQARLFIQMIDKFFNCVTCKGPKMAMVKGKADIAPYSKISNYRFKVNMS